VRAQHLIRGEYHTRGATAPGSGALGGAAGAALAPALLANGLTADQLVQRYCTLLYAETGSYQKTARRLGLDRRTVRAHINRGVEPGDAGESTPLHAPGPSRA
jgi:DNA-binding CsgD family transcriptional regulator